jgi:hypothetical protein
MFAVAAGVGGERLFRGGKEKLLEELENERRFAGILMGLLRLVVLRVGALLERVGIWILRSAGRLTFCRWSCLAICGAEPAILDALLKGFDE